MIAELIIVNDIKRKKALVQYLLINLNLIVDRPDGLIKEGKNLTSPCYSLMSAGKYDAISIVASKSSVVPWAITFWWK